MTDGQEALAPAPQKLDSEQAQNILAQHIDPLLLDSLRDSSPVTSAESLSNLIKLIGRQGLHSEVSRLPTEIVAWGEVVDRNLDFVSMEAAVEEYHHDGELSETSQLELQFAAQMSGYVEELTIELAELLQSTQRDENKIRIIRDALRAQMIIMHINRFVGQNVSYELMPYFFQQSRNVVGPASAAQTLLLQLWEEIAVKQQGEVDRDEIEAKIRKFTEENAETYQEGRYTGDTRTEIARDHTLVNWLLAKKLLPPSHVKVIDFGAYDGNRRLKPLIDILKAQGYSFQQGDIVGVDVANPEDFYDEMTPVHSSFVEAGKNLALQGRFDLCKIDWSSRNADPTVRGQMLAIAAVNRTLKMDGIVIEDTVLTEGEGSLDEQLRSIKEKLRNIPEGFYTFKYPNSQETVDVLLNYYDFLIQFYIDAGFRILNLPPGWEPNPEKTDEENEREQRKLIEEYLQRVIPGNEDINSNRADAIRSPVWKTNGPRITIVLQKKREVAQTRNHLLKKLLLEEYGPSLFSTSVEDVLQEAA